MLQTSHWELTEQNDLCYQPTKADSVDILKFYVKASSGIGRFSKKF